MSKTPSGQIDRTGSVWFSDAAVHITEEGLSDARRAGGFKAADDWELRFKRQVFARVLQMLNRIGWTCVVPPKEEKQNSASFARNFRNCSKGDLKGELGIMGRSITFEMWQGVNTPTRSDHGGRYESNKEACMPYPLRLEMERTRRRIRDYLCNVFAGYTFKPPSIEGPNPDPLAYFNDHWDGDYDKARGGHRFKRGADGWPSDAELSSWDRKDKDGALLNHGDVRWTRDRKGRLMRGRVYGGINGMWMFVYGPGRSDYTQEAGNAFFTYVDGESPRKAIDLRLRRKRLESEMKKAVDRMDFKRAQVLKDVLFPSGSLYAIYHKGHAAYFGISYCGYVGSISDAGRYTRAELPPYLGNKLETERFKAVLVSN